ncbi:MAG: hypothetical protein K6F78_00505 [Bacteroidaceae bacterium]|nr:hypothetical protein [Bacteroidaceae bacterium]
MWKYGRKIIDALFKRRTERIAICAELTTRSKADSDRSDIRVFEAGLSTEQHGDYEQSKGNAAQEKEGNRLIAIAKANHLFIEKEKWEQFGDRKQLQSGESIVYLSTDGGKVIKVRNPFAKASIKQLHACDAIYEHLVHNVLFPNTRYHFEGISEDVDGVRIILSQDYIPDTYTTPSQEVIDKYLINGLGLSKENRYFYANDFIAITDVSAEGDNVLTDGKKLYFIDPIIKMKRSAVEVLDYYYDLLA